jgi:hypothetical protein
MSENSLGSDVHTESAKTRSWLTGKWSPLCRIVENTPGKRSSDMCRPDGPGVYRLIALDADMPGIVPASLDRVCGIDPTGTLYIGATRSLQRRVASLVRSNKTNDLIVGGSGGHQIMTGKLARQFAPRWRAITWQRLDSVDWRNREQALFRDYRARFGELPPMNQNG